MIKSKSDLMRYLAQDLANADYTGGVKSYFFNEIWRYLRLLRYYEYYINCNQGLVSKLCAYWFEFRIKRLGARLGFSIPPNVFGPGLSLPHIGTIVVNPKARIGENCRLHVCVNIGAGRYDSQVPVIGNDCYIGPGAKIFGGISLGDRVSIGANAVVNKSFMFNDITLVGVPAKAIIKTEYFDE